MVQLVAYGGRGKKECVVAANRSSCVKGGWASIMRVEKVLIVHIRKLYEVLEGGKL